MRPALCRAVIILMAAEMSVIIGSNIVIYHNILDSNYIQLS